jgi:hypothetical protein
MTTTLILEGGSVYLKSELQFCFYSRYIVGHLWDALGSTPSLVLVEASNKLDLMTLLPEDGATAYLMEWLDTLYRFCLYCMKLVICFHPISIPATSPIVLSSAVIPPTLD